MAFYYIAFLTLMLCEFISSAILLWGSNEIQIPALKEFNDDDYKQLLHETENPQVIAFRSKSISAAHNINKLLPNLTTAYIPNCKVTIDNIIDLTDDQEDDFGVIENMLKNTEHILNKLVVLIITNEDRFKRKADNFTTDDTEEFDLPYEEPVGDPVLYSATSPNDVDLEAMVYSSKPPLLRFNTSIIYLGKATVNKMDIRDSYTRLISTIPVNNGKITLRFKFHWFNGYWYMNSIEVEFVGIDTRQYNLTLNNELTAPRRFSYHCADTTLFTDIENDIELNLFEIQAQPDAYKHRFSDAYNCVPFVTIPILSGLFVTFILAAGLVVSLSALSSIKVTDKFDNQKTKQLTLTISE